MKQKGQKPPVASGANRLMRPDIYSWLGRVSSAEKVQKEEITRDKKDRDKTPGTAAGSRMSS
jgi:hypothetical protein